MTKLDYTLADVFGYLGIDYTSQRIICANKEDPDNAIAILKGIKPGHKRWQYGYTKKTFDQFLKLAGYMYVEKGTKLVLKKSLKDVPKL